MIPYPVHLLSRPDEVALATLKSQLVSDVVLTFGEEVPAETRILVGGRPSLRQLSAPHLHALIIPWAGLPVETRELMHDFSHLTIHNLHHNAAPVAELTLALLLSAAKFIVPFDQALRQHDWTPRYEPNPSLLLSGKTAVILGYGAIGQRVAQVCRALGMTVLATRRHPQGNDGIAHEIHPPSALPELLPRAYALIICLPLTPETEGLLGADELALLPQEAVLVNIGRGTIVDEAALYNALREGQIKAAGLDVWYNYPPDKDGRSHTPPAAYPFHELENVVLSPHRGGHVVETEQLRMTGLAELLNTAVAGQPIPNRVNLERGY